VCLCRVSCWCFVTLHHLGAPRAPGRGGGAGPDPLFVVAERERAEKERTALIAQRQAEASERANEETKLRAEKKAALVRACVRV
jgi:hypothetical protein